MEPPSREARQDCRSYAGRQDWPSLIKIGEIRLLQVEEPAERGSDDDARLSAR